MRRVIRWTFIGVLDVVAVTLLTVLFTSSVHAAATGQSSMPSSSIPERERTPEEKAKIAFNAGVRAVNKADKYADANKTRKANDRYADAREQFERAVELAPSLPEAWNYLGYTRRKLGDYESALVAYDKALSLRPSFSEAIEYRGEAYLRMQRFDDAKAAYLDLFAGNRKLADKLLGSMQSWVDTQQKAGTPGLEDFAKWIQERSQIAGQTAALTREGAGASWR